MANTVDASARTFAKRVGPTSYRQVKNLPYYNSPQNPFEVNPKTGGNCTWYAWGRFCEVAALGGKKLSWSYGGGDACRFYSIMVGNGKLKGGTLPKPGAIICWGYDGKPYAGWGHVAFVEQVNMKNGVVDSIEVSQSGWSSGPMKNATLKAGTGKPGTGAYKMGYRNSYFNGFIYNPIDFGNPAGAVADNTGLIVAEDVAGEVDMRRRITRLYSSDNYERVKYIDDRTETQRIAEEQRTKLKNTLSKIDFSSTTVTSAAFPESVVSISAPSVAKQRIEKVSSFFDISRALVQAPFVELDIGGYTIGSYNGSTDKYPNYISRLDVKKINGEINQYTIGLIYQIRPGENPNLLDELFSKVRYNKIKIRYGDCESGSLFKDSEAIITNIVQNRDYAGSRITYTIYATSACNYVTSVKFDFKSITDKPSNIIRDLLYRNNETSGLLTSAFSGMMDRLYVESNNYIPTNDAVINVEAKANMDSLSYINYLVGCMSNATNGINSIIRNSNYFITYNDSDRGSYFKIDEIVKTTSTSALTRNIFNITVGFPDGNDVYDFKINNNESWSMLYENSSVSNEYIYNINNKGNRTLNYSPNLSSSSGIMNEIQKNWWTQMTTYPISAQLTMRGLLRPVNLMDYVHIDVVFYGQKHITSGLYVITGEQDILSGSGFLTNLSLLRVGD